MINLTAGVSPPIIAKVEMMTEPGEVGTRSISTPRKVVYQQDPAITKFVRKSKGFVMKTWDFY